jgi:hypothetical protein
MSRGDLLALTPATLTVLANAGFVKRAQKDLEQGKGPRLEELPDGTVVGTFEDGVTTRLVPGKAFKDSPCTCNASAVCRHRVATALAYPAWHAATARPGAEAPAPPPSSPWSPGEVEDAELERRLPSTSLERARGHQKRGYLAQVRRGTLQAEGRAYENEREPRVSLATCTVRFLTPRELSTARCDCKEQHDCEHLALAIWAFRAADAKDPQAAEVAVEVALRSVEQTVGGAVLHTTQTLVSDLLLEGAQHAGAGLASRFAVVRAGLEQAGMAWPLAALDALEEQLNAYVGRSARYAPARLTLVLTELFARPRAARTGSTVPPRAVLGMDEAPETPLSKAVSLVSLGARTFAEGQERRVEVVLVDPAAAGLLVVRRAFTYTEPQTPEDGPQLGRRRALSNITLEALARGQVLTEGAKRLTNRLVMFSSQGLQRTSVTPQSGDWSRLPAPVRVDDVRALEAEWKTRPPRFLRPRQLAENVHAFALGRVVDVTYAPGAQEVHADVEDAHGTAFRVELAHRQVAPGALDALGEALTGRHGKPRYVSGEVRRTARGLVVEPLAVVCEDTGVWVLDLQPPRTLNAPPRADASPPLPPLRALLAAVEDCLADGAHQGLRHASPAWTARLGTLGTRARGLGLTRLAGDLETLGRRLTTARSSGSAGDEAALANAWADAAVRVWVAQEQLEG